MNLWRCFSLCLVLLGGASVFAAETGPVYVIPVREEISGPQSVFLKRAVKEAERNHASAIVLDMDTYGGEVHAAIEEMDALLKSVVPTFTFIDSKAISAGALITLATQHVYITPGGVIGAAAPVSSTGEDLPSTMTDKTISAISAVARGAAQKTGHNPDLADAFIRKSATLKIGEVVLDGPDTLLSLDATEATRKFDNKPLLAEGVAGSLSEMTHMAGLTGTVREVSPTGFERLAVWLTAIAPLLLAVGIVAAFIEFKTPGAVIPGAVAAVCFILFFSSSYLAGLSGLEAMILFFIGVALVLSELTLHPGTIVPGLVGIFLIFTSLVWAMVDRYPGDPFLPTSQMLMRPLINLTLAIVFASVAIYYLGKYLPKTTLFRKFVLAETDPRGTVIEAARQQVSPGANGTVRTTLRPSGKAEIAGDVIDVISRGEFIPAGEPVRVVAVEGARVVVEAA
jgi:membrane-bound serine protease (ClpP class)